MDKIAIKEEASTNGKRSIRWKWPLGALIIVFLAVVVSSRISFFFKDRDSHSFLHQESGIYKGTTKQEKLKAPIKLFRERAPTSYLVTFESCAKMVDLVKDGYFESNPFTVDGFNWTFIIYPNGNKKETWYQFVSLYARIDNSSLITNPQDVYSEIKFFIYNVFYRQYYYYQETEAIKFDLFKPEWGVPEFLATTGLTVPGYGYIFDGGKCAFGIDAFVAQRYKNSEVVSYNESISNPIFTWKLTNFSTLKLNSYTSDSFSSGGRNWVLKVYPNGDGAGTDSSLSLYLLSESNGKDYVRAKLRVLNQIRANQVERQVEGWPNATENGWGFQKFIPLADLQDASKGFVVDDLLEVEVEIMAFSKHTPFN